MLFLKDYISMSDFIIFFLLISRLFSQRLRLSPVTKLFLFITDQGVLPKHLSTSKTILLFLRMCVCVPGQLVTASGQEAQLN